MALEFRLPDVGEGLAEAEIVQWRVAAGDVVAMDSVLVEIETDKAIVEIPAPVDGTILRLGAEEGETIAVGSILVVIDDGSDDADSETIAPAVIPASTSDVPSAGVSRRPTPHRPRATPATRSRARKLGVDLADVTPTGPGDRITDADVERAAAAEVVVSASTMPSSAEPTGLHEAPLAGDKRVPLKGVRATTARVMLESWQSVPHVSSMHELDYSKLNELRSDLATDAQPISMTAFMVKATARALGQYPMLNATVDVDNGAVIYKENRNIGVAVNTRDGLVVPVIMDAGTKPLSVIDAELRELGEQARNRSLPLSSLQGGTFTVNNYGPLGGWFGTSIIKPPEVGILSFGPAVERPVVRDGAIVVRSVGVMVLGADHRVADGEQSIGFCTRTRQLLEAPASLLLEP